MYFTSFFCFRCKTTYGVLELYRNNELLHPADDNKTLGQTDGRDRIVSEWIFFSSVSLLMNYSIYLQPITVRWLQHPSQTGSSGESSSSESEISNNGISSHHNRVLDTIDANAENALPSVVN